MLRRRLYTSRKPWGCLRRRKSPHFPLWPQFHTPHINPLYKPFYRNGDAVRSIIHNQGFAVFRHGRGEDGGCRVCGVPASLVVLRREDADIFEGYMAYARCICASTKPSRPWRCPNCGAEGRENFELFIKGGAPVEARSMRLSIWRSRGGGRTSSVACQVFVA